MTEATLKRSFGISLAAVLCALGALIGILFTGLMVVSLLLNPRAIPAPGVSIATPMIVATIGIAFTFWAIATAVGLWKLRTWARWSVLVYAGFLLFTNLSSGFVMAVVPLPPVPNAPVPNAPNGMMQTIRYGLVGFYGLLAVLSGAWLVYFTRDSVKSQFAGANPVPEPSRRPISISIVGYMLLIFGVIGLWSVFTPIPAILLGFII